ncbi:uncharacterized protein NDAI_0A04000 [Naumovozyma dairenensis CBS 421]|uniref:Uncharacterized protein n=1 Tax=Naumovozyma dairenensis (strain ATCC 10597 / BCRC 20456 / CBS 421 / NBRC 0211 / NRRL Y-12639) TaxID=1071378 RepID=G0W419_NAUDC|nr:hypothetical protein NDAI_0A04000 [Naumovozyma dairenensis CBS 421]CCD22557.1 hypothetical protein NDAI_0A04000 [Naumovozyma dairenensis CBS 421]
MSESVFEPGYNRRESPIKEPLYRAIKVDLRVLPQEVTKPTLMKRKTDHPLNGFTQNQHEDEQGIMQATLLNNKTHGEVTDSPVVSNVYDPKNQLRSLVKNAERNKDALKRRNEHIKKMKANSRSRFGW